MRMRTLRAAQEDSLPVGRGQATLYMQIVFLCSTKYRFFLRRRGRAAEV
jgi:hypothetical protein